MTNLLFFCKAEVFMLFQLWINFCFLFLVHKTLQVSYNVAQRQKAFNPQQSPEKKEKENM